MESDFELLDAWRGGDKVAGDRLFRRHFRGLLRFFFNKIDEAEVEDLLQRTLLACVESRDRFQGRSSFRTYLFTVARNQLMTFLRRKHARAVDLGVSSVADLGTSPSEFAVKAEKQRLLLAALQRLTIDQQIALELHYWEGLEAAELAEVFGIDPTTARTRLHRTRRALKTTLEELSASPQLRADALGGLDTWARDLAMEHKHARDPGPERVDDG